MTRNPFMKRLSLLCVVAMVVLSLFGCTQQPDASSSDVSPSQTEGEGTATTTTGSESTDGTASTTGTSAEKSTQTTS